MFKRMLTGLLCLFSVLSLAGSPSPPASDATPIYDQCKVNADCVVKNVGNCCGYFPQCVNRQAKVNPKKVQEECRKEGRSGVCGFADIQRCECQSGQCAAIRAKGPLLLQ